MEAQIVTDLKKLESRISVKEISKKYGISEEAIFDN